MSPDEARAEAVRRIEQARAEGAWLLDLGDLPLTDLGPLAGLAALKSLDLSRCTDVTDLGPLAGLAALQSLNLSMCLDVTDLGPLAGLAALQSLDLWNCSGVTDLGPLAGLQALQSLGCIGTGVTDLGPLAGLAELKWLRLTYCHGLKTFDRLHEQLPALEELYLGGCRFTAPEDPPTEVCGKSYGENVLDKVRAHYADLDHGAVEDAEVKLFVLGNGGAGKTQTCERLCGRDFDERIPSTHGIRLDEFRVALEGRSAPVTVRLWDFGGQDVYHGTHALFLQGHAVFVLLWADGREEGPADENGVPIRHRPLAYWLDYVRGLAGTDCPLLVVQSRCDEPRQRRQPPTLPDDFRFWQPLQFSAKTGLGLGVLREAIKEAVRNLIAERPLRHIGAGRARMRTRLRQMLTEDQKRPPAERQHRTLTRAEFRAVCDEKDDVSDAGLLLDYLHQSDVVFYRPGLFEDRIILDRAWALEAVYTVFDRQRTLPHLCRDGRFTRQTLELLAWEKYSAEEQATFLGMMRSCGICFSAKNLAPRGKAEQWEYIAPDLLPEESDPWVREQLLYKVPDGAPDAAATVRYRFLHEGILRTFLSRVGEQARDAAVYWKYGCWFNEQTTGSRVLIRGHLGTEGEESGAGEVTLSAWGGGAAKLIDACLETLLRIPSGQPPAVERTPDAAARPERDAGAAVPGVVGLVIVPPPTPPPGGKPEVFLSYAWGEDTAQREELVDRLYERLCAWGYKPVRDKADMRRGDLISEFMKRIISGNRVIIVLSEKYLRSVFCMSELHGAYIESRGKKEDFLRHFIPLTLDDARIGSIRDRAAHVRYWKKEAGEISQLRNEGLLGVDDYAKVLTMTRWTDHVSDILAYIADTLHPIGFESIRANDFAAVKDLLERGR